MTRTLAVDIKDLKVNIKERTCLDIPSLEIEEGETVVLFGENGAGKTTLLKALSGLIPVKASCLEILGQDFLSIPQKKIDQLRADHIGYVFQNLYLIPYLTALENILLPCGFSRKKKENVLKSSISAEYEAYMLMARLKFEDPLRLRHKADQLSKGLQQRVAVARALIGGPKLILADEPTSAMGSYSKKIVYKLLIEYAKEHGSTLICITHNKEADRYFDRQVNMKDINKSAETNPLW